jgi:uncharacterized membrane protein YuzA (DUF378 family)
MSVESQLFIHDQLFESTAAVPKIMGTLGSTEVAIIDSLGEGSKHGRIHYRVTKICPILQFIYSISSVSTFGRILVNNFNRALGTLQN